MIPFNGWQPDIPDLLNPGVTEANNCIPHIDGFIPLQTFTTATSALTARCRGAVAAQDKDGATYVYCGDTTKLYVQAGASFTDVTRTTAYATATDEYWEFAKWGNKVIATNFTDDMQVITLGAANFTNLQLLFKARNLAVVRDFVVAANTYDGSDGNVPHRVRWSAIGDETSWTVSAATQADYQDIQGNGGFIQRVVGGEYGVIFQERSVWRMTYVGSPGIFQFDEVLPGYGTPARNSVVQQGDEVFYLAQDGFKMIVNGTTINHIGADKVDQWFFNNVDSTYVDRIFGAADPVNHVIIWAIPVSGNSGGTPNKLLIFDRSSGKWSSADVELEAVFSGQSAGYTLEQLDSVSSSLDSLPYSLDSRYWAGGSLYIGGFDGAHKLGQFSGSDMEATITTAEIMIEGRRQMITSTLPHIQGGSGYVKVGTRNTQAETVSYSSESSPQTSGNVPVRSNARYVRFKVRIPGGFDYAKGISYKGRQEGFR